MLRRDKTGYVDVKIVNEFTSEGQTGICTFEQINACAWSQDLKGDFSLTIQSGPTLSSDTGPQVDHTKGTGIKKARIYLTILNEYQFNISYF
jgi:hypothetical protein